jgi:hypothetical protein
MAGVLVAMKRPVFLLLALTLPMGFLLSGVLLTGWGLEQLLVAVRLNLDAPDLPEVVLTRRAVAWEGGLVGGLLGVLLCLPVVMGASVASLRPEPAKKRSWISILMMLFLGSPGPLLVVIGGFSQGWGTLFLPLLFLPLLLLGMVSLGGWGRVYGMLGGLLGCLMLLVGTWGWASQLWGEEEQFRGLLLERISIVPTLSSGVFLVAISYCLGWVGLDWKKKADFWSGVGVLAWGILLGVGLSWVSIRQLQLGRIAGMYEATLAQLSLDSQWGSGVPLVESLPGRILVASSLVPRWVERGQGGLSSKAIGGELMDIGSELQRGDGILVPEKLSMEDFYLMLSGSDVGRVGLVGCRPPQEIRNPKVLVLILRDPLMTVGWCGVMPLFLRIEQGYQPDRELILLKDKEVDEEGEIRKIQDLAFTGQVVKVRAQVDAKFGDFQALLWQLLVNSIPSPPDDHALLQQWSTEVRAARVVYLGWGVQLDGEDLPVGVD